LSVCAPVETRVDLREVVCPRCLPKMRRVLVRAAPGAVVEAYCRHCKYRAIVLVI
jgi:hypothetical protein